MHKNEAHEFLYTRMTELLLQRLYGSSYSLLNLPFWMPPEMTHLGTQASKVQKAFPNQMS